MSKASFVTAMFAALAVACYCGNIEYIDCGRNEILDIRIEPCPKAPCQFNVGDKASVFVDFVANHNASEVILHGNLKTGGIFPYETPYTGLENPMACAPGNLPCPLVAGRKYTFRYTGTVPRYNRFSIFRTSVWKLVGSRFKTLVCAEIPFHNS